MAMTYLQLVNDVLARLRETSVASVSTNAYSLLIGKFINDAKRQVEDSWNWDALSTQLTVTTSGGTSAYPLTGSGYRCKINEVNNTTYKSQISNIPISAIKDWQQLTTAQTGAPSYYGLSGMSSGNVIVEFYPTPNSAYSIIFNCYVPQADLSNDSDVLLIPSEAVIAGAYARALVERGEDGGLSSSEAYGLYKGILADQIAIESTRFIENECWVAT